MTDDDLAAIAATVKVPRPVHWRQAELLLAEVQRLRAALEQIRDRSPVVCGEYEICRHVGCASSHRAWEIADAALRGLERSCHPRKRSV